MFWWLTFAINWFSGDVCWWKRSHSVSVARVGEKLVRASRVLVRSKPQWFCATRKVADVATESTLFLLEIT